MNKLSKIPRNQLEKLFIELDKYCEKSANGTNPAPKGYWKNVELQYLKIKKGIENAAVKT